MLLYELALSLGRPKSYGAVVLMTRMMTGFPTDMNAIMRPADQLTEMQVLILMLLEIREPTLTAMVLQIGENSWAQQILPTQVHSLPPQTRTEILFMTLMNPSPAKLWTPITMELLTIKIP